MCHEQFLLEIDCCITIYILKGSIMSMNINLVIKILFSIKNHKFSSTLIISKLSSFFSFKYRKESDFNIYITTC